MRRTVADRLARDEEGIALILALAVMLVLSLTSAALLFSGTTNQRSALVSANQEQAFSLAQTALAYAEGAVYSAAANHTQPPIGSQTLPGQPGGGTATYVTSVGTDGVTWTMTGTGTVGGSTRVVTAQANVPSPVTVTDTGIWNYLYADNNSGHATNTCETTIQGGTTVSVPMLVRDNLCITGGAHFLATQLEVGGNLTVNGGANVGTSSKPVSTVKIAGTPSSTACTNGYSGSTTPGTGNCDGKHASLYSSVVGTNLDLQPAMPTVDFQQHYADQAALTQSGCPAGLFDNDGTRNNSLSAATLTARLFPYSYYPTPLSYDCHVGTNEIKWQQTSTASSNGTLTVNGTFFFDGSISLGSGQQVIYNGQGTLYFTGGATFAGGSQFCGITGCTTSWNPDVNGIIIVANCWANSTGSSLIASGCVDITGGAKVQIGVYVTTNYTIDGGTTNMGPVLADTLTISGGSSTLIPFHNMPKGTPLNTQTSYLPASSPTNWGG